MRTTIIFVSTLLFINFIASSFYTQHCYMQYINLCQKRAPVGMLTRLRASLVFTHDPHDPNLSDECKTYFSRFKIAAMVSVSTLLLAAVFILSLRSFGLQEALD